MMSGVGVSLDYGRERAPQDVLDSLDWLAEGRVSSLWMNQGVQASRSETWWWSSSGPRW